jgi:CheY-like chemotaxis protein
MKTLLDDFGFESDIADNGKIAVKKLQDKSYDVILMDVEMPEMDGLRATAFIHQEWEQEKCPWIVAVTAYAMQGDREECLAAGMDDYITKPIRVDALVLALNQAKARDAS